VSVALQKGQCIEPPQNKMAAKISGH